MLIKSNIEKLEIDQVNKKIYVYYVQDNSHLMSNPPPPPSYYREVYCFDNLELNEDAEVERATEKITYKDMDKKENTAESIGIKQTIKETETNSILEKIPTFPLSVASGGQTASIVNVTSGTELTSTGTSTAMNQWSNPKRVEVDVIGETIEMVYKQTSLITVGSYPSYSSQERVFKIVYSCVDGKWNKSEPIYGKVIPKQSIREYYEFEN